MLSIVEMPRVIFSPDSAGMRKTNLKCEMFIFMAVQDEFDELSELRVRYLVHIIWCYAGLVKLRTREKCNLLTLSRLFDI